MAGFWWALKSVTKNWPSYIWPIPASLVDTGEMHF
jgi:hypothetical protein